MLLEVWGYLHGKGFNFRSQTGFQILAVGKKRQYPGVTLMETNEGAVRKFKRLWISVGAVKWDAGEGMSKEDLGADAVLFKPWLIRFMYVWKKNRVCESAAYKVSRMLLLEKHVRCFCGTTWTISQEHFMWPHEGWENTHAMFTPHAEALQWGVDQRLMGTYGVVHTRLSSSDRYQLCSCRGSRAH